MKKNNNSQSFKKNILIIGAGIHGSFMAIYLKNKYKSVNIDLIDKNKFICSGTSASTHNRANRGYHYPRSPKTAKECLNGWKYFKSNYGKFLDKIDYSYYAIEKKSKTSTEKYKRFLDKNKLYYKIEDNKFFNKKNITTCFKAFEGCFDHKKIVQYLINQFKKKKINFISQFELKKVTYDKKNNFITLESEDEEIIKKRYDLIFNSTYDNTNIILKKFKIKNLIKQKIQYTSIPVVKIKKKIPGLTVMDGDYVTIMPFKGLRNTYLLYDCKNSISYKSYKEITNTKNYFRILEKIKEYYNIKTKIKFHKYLMGKRPIPFKDENADRFTYVKKNNYNKIPIYSIFEGKYISAAHFTRQFVKKLKI